MEIILQWKQDYRSEDIEKIMIGAGRNRSSKFLFVADKAQGNDRAGNSSADVSAHNNRYSALQRKRSGGD